MTTEQQRQHRAPRKVAQSPAYRPKPGTPVKDAATGFVGVFQTIESLKADFKPVVIAYIRPFGGGVEIETTPDMLREPTQDEVLSAKVEAANRQSRAGVR